MKNFIVLIACFALAACSTTQKLTVTSKPVSVSIKKQAAPRDLDLSDPHWIVVTANNFDQIKEKYAKGGKFTIYGVTPEDYKKILKNQTEFKRYIDQQKAIIVYYEDASEAK